MQIKINKRTLNLAAHEVRFYFTDPRHFMPIRNRPIRLVSAEMYVTGGGAKPRATDGGPGLSL